MFAAITMEKAILTKPEEPLEVVKDAVPSVPAKGLLIKMLYSGICQSDLKLQTGAVDIGDGKKMNYLQCIGNGSGIGGSKKTSFSNINKI